MNAQEIAAKLTKDEARSYWYRQGKDDGVQHERERVLAWLRAKPERYARLLADYLERGDHLDEKG
jgi:hypothetical protein